MPSIKLTRIPVRTNNDVNNFVKRIIAYEQQPPSSNWSKDILMCATNLHSDSLPQDGYLINEAVYTYYISPYWDGEKKVLSNVFSDVNEDSTYLLTKDHLQEQLSKGFAFVNINCHGETKIYKMPDVNYSDIDAMALNNIHPTLITTSACLTNAFEWHDLDNYKCLSEAFLLNPNSNIFAYLGCSREGWGKKITYPIISETILGASDKLTGAFYKHLFINNQSQKAFGSLVNSAKAEFSNRYGEYSTNRWVCFGVNPLGDPEMPIYSRIMNDINIKSITYENGHLTLGNDSEGGLHTLIRSLGNNGESFSFTDDLGSPQDLGPWEVPENVSVYITGQNRNPFFFFIKDGDIYIQNETFSRNISFKAKHVFVGKDVTNLKPEGPVHIDSGEVHLIGKEVVVKNTFEIKQGATLIINGE